MQICKYNQVHTSIHNLEYQHDISYVKVWVYIQANVRYDVDIMRIIDAHNVQRADRARR